MIFLICKKKYQYYNQVLNKYWDRSTLDQSKNEKCSTLG